MLCQFPGQYQILVPCTSDVRDQLLVKLSLHLAGINEDKICKQTIEICTNSQNESSNQAD